MRTLITCTIAALVLLAVSCSDSGTGPDSDTLTPISPHDFDIVGMWEVVHVDGAIDPDGNPLQVDSTNGILTFYPDGTFHFFFRALPYYDEETWGLYSVNADTLRWTGDIARFFHGTTMISTYVDHFEYLDRDNDRWRFRLMRLVAEAPDYRTIQLTGN